MNKKPVIALLGDFPVWYIAPELGRKEGWHYSPFLVALHEALKMVDAYDIHWVCLRKEVKRYRRLSCANQIFHVLPGGSLAFADLTGFLFDRRKVQRVLKSIQPDIVHAWGSESRYAKCGIATVPHTILSMLGIMTAVAKHGALGFYMRRRTKEEPLMLRGYELVTVESQWGIEKCREVCANRRYVRWEYAVDPGFYTYSHMPQEHPMFLMAGYDAPFKNYDTAIKAFSDARLSHVQLILAGVSTAQRPNLPPNIQAIGGVPHERIAELLSQSWGLLHPSLVDTSPNIVKEARVIGTPVIVSRECGGIQYVVHEKSGFIVDPSDTEAIIRSVLSIVRSREESLTMGKYDCERCRHLLSPETMKTRLCEIYDAVLAGVPEQIGSSPLIVE